MECARLVALSWMAFAASDGTIELLGTNDRAEFMAANKPVWLVLLRNRFEKCAGQRNWLNVLLGFLLCKECGIVPEDVCCVALSYSCNQGDFCASPNVKKSSTNSKSDCKKR